MVDISGLSSPMIVLGGLYWTGENKRQYTGGMDGVDILAGGFGASSAQWAGEQVQNLVGSGTLTPLLSQALVGAGLSEYGDMVPYNDAMARGIHLNVAQQAFGDAGFTAGDLMGDTLGNIGGGSENGTQTTQEIETADSGVVTV